MIVGIDVYHEKHKQVPSIVGLVASLDKTFTQWCSVVKKQHNTHQEIMGSVQISFHELLRKYKEVSFFKLCIFLSTKKSYIFMKYSVLGE